MKKSLLAVLGLVVSISLFVGCSLDGSWNVIEGTWTHWLPAAREATFKFTGSNFVYTRNDGIRRSGTFQLEGSALILIVDDETVYRYLYESSGDQLHLDGRTEGFGYNTGETL